jgi:hypothetical protein
MRLDEVSDGRLVELLAQYVLEHDPMPEVAVVPSAVLAEVARRTAARSRRHRNKLRRDAEQHHTGP